jgi:AraC-like DNA-binding protein
VVIFVSEYLEHQGTDVLADVLDSLKLRGRFFCRCELSAPWALGFAGGFFSHFHVIGSGSCWLKLQDGSAPVALEEGDLVLVIPRGSGYQLGDDLRTPPIPLSELVGNSEGGLRAVIKHGAGGRETSLICGAFEFRGPRADSSLAVLPQWIRVSKRESHSNEWLSATVKFLQKETQDPGMGSETIITRLIDVIFVEAVRTWLKEQPQGAAGWLGALRDPSIGTALGLIHKAPEKPWTVSSLAAQVGMSRSPFAARFTALVGHSPMSYLKRWRLQVAAGLLRDQTLSLSNIADRVGYESTPAFSRVFKREFGVAPGQYRRSGTISGQASDAEMQEAIPSNSRARAVHQPKAVSSAAN